MSRLSKHFVSEEFRCKGKHGCILVPPPPSLLLVLEQIRCDIGHKPMKIVSGYRCERHNDAVGGAFASRHLRGDAVDLPEGLVPVEVAIQAGATGVGTRGQWATHVDVRPGPLVKWSYS